MLAGRLCLLVCLGCVDCLRVSELNEYARQALFECFGSDIWVVGEIHGFKEHAKTGHVYFELVEKDPSNKDVYVAKIGCAFFHGAITAWRRFLKAKGFGDFGLADGMEVKLRARVDIFVREGRYQLIVSEVDPVYTLGAIARQREKTIAQLRAEGLLDRNKNLELDPVPLEIGLITSVGSAAYQDFTSIILASGFAFRIHVYDAHMQGDRTVSEVIRGIRRLLSQGDLDVIAIIRGGGAKTDLFVFDDLSLCRSIAACPVPVLTGIGHEIDLTVADIVANRSFVTPTDAARFLVSCVNEVWNFLESAADLTGTTARRILDASSKRLELACARLAVETRSTASRLSAGVGARMSRLWSNATAVVSAHASRLSARQAALRETARSHLREAATRIDSLARSLGYTASALTTRVKDEILHGLAVDLRELASRLRNDMGLLDAMEQSISLMDPLLTLKRGYSITVGPHGRAIRSTEDVGIGDTITTVLFEGRIHSRVFDKE